MFALFDDFTCTIAEKEGSVTQKRTALQLKSTALERSRVEQAQIDAENAQLQLAVDSARSDLAEAKQNVTDATKSKLAVQTKSATKLAKLSINDTCGVQATRSSTSWLAAAWRSCTRFTRRMPL